MTSVEEATALPRVEELPTENVWVLWRGPVSQPSAPNGSWHSYPHLQNVEAWRQLMVPRLQEFCALLDQYGIRVDSVECEVCKRSDMRSCFEDDVIAGGGKYHLKKLWALLLASGPAQWNEARVPGGALRYSYVDGVIQLCRGEPAEASAKEAASESLKSSHMMEHSSARSVSTTGASSNSSGAVGSARRSSTTGGSSSSGGVASNSARSSTATGGVSGNSARTSTTTASITSNGVSGSALSCGSSSSSSSSAKSRRQSAKASTLLLPAARVATASIGGCSPSSSSRSTPPPPPPAPLVTSTSAAAAASVSASASAAASAYSSSGRLRRPMPPPSMQRSPLMVPTDLPPTAVLDSFQELTGIDGAADRSPASDGAVAAAAASAPNSTRAPAPWDFPASGVEEDIMLESALGPEIWTIPEAEDSEHEDRITLEARPLGIEIETACNGIGAKVSHVEGHAEEAGVEVGSTILAINEHPVEDMPTKEIQGMLEVEPVPITLDLKPPLNLPTVKKRKARKKDPVTVCTAHCRSSHRVVSEAIQRLGWQELPADTRTASIVWLEHQDPVDGIAPVQTVSRIDAFYHFCQKARLAQSLNAWTEELPDVFAFSPQTWVLPWDLAELKASMSKSKDTYICKPTAGCQGKGITLARKWKDLESIAAKCKAFLESTSARMPLEYVVQRYIAQPLLIDKLKFDMRLYMVITSVVPLRAYLFKEGLARFCTTPYQPPKEGNLKDARMHLTNFAVNKKSQNFQASDSLEHHDEGSKRSVSSVLRQIANTYGGSVEELWGKVGALAANTLMALRPAILEWCDEKSKPLHPLGPKSFQIVGLDVMIDSDLEPRLLELNANSSLNVMQPGKDVDTDTDPPNVGSPAQLDGDKPLAAESSSTSTAGAPQPGVAQNPAASPSAGIDADPNSLAGSRGLVKHTVQPGAALSPGTSAQAASLMPLAPALAQSQPVASAGPAAATAHATPAAVNLNYAGASALVTGGMQVATSLASAIGPIRSIARTGMGESRTLSKRGGASLSAVDLKSSVGKAFGFGASVNGQSCVAGSKTLTRSASTVETIGGSGRPISVSQRPGSASGDVQRNGSGQGSTATSRRNSASPGRARLLSSVRTQKSRLKRSASRRVLSTDPAAAQATDGSAGGGGSSSSTAPANVISELDFEIKRELVCQALVLAKPAPQNKTSRLKRMWNKDKVIDELVPLDDDGAWALAAKHTRAKAVRGDAPERCPAFDPIDFETLAAPEVVEYAKAHLDAYRLWARNCGQGKDTLGQPQMLRLIERMNLVGTGHLFSDRVTAQLWLSRAWRDTACGAYGLSFKMFLSLARKLGQMINGSPEAECEMDFAAQRAGIIAFAGRGKEADGPAARQLPPIGGTKKR